MNLRNGSARSPSDRSRQPPGASWRRLGWLGLLVIIGLGGAGIVNAMDHQPGSAARAELTSVGDREVVPLLDAATTDLSALADQVAALGVQARGALAALNGVDTATVDEAIAAGNELVTDLRVRSFALRRELAAVPYVGTPGVTIALSADLAARHAALVAAIDATEGLDDAWERLTLGSVSATRMSGLLASARRPRRPGRAADGRRARYEDAMALLDQADATIAQARQLRNQLANTVDVTVLDQWLDRNAAYDKALRALYKIDLDDRQPGDRRHPEGQGGRGSRRGGRTRPAAARPAWPGRDHGRDRSGRHERGGDRDRGGARQADRRDRRQQPRRRPSRDRPASRDRPRGPAASATP